MVLAKRLGLTRVYAPAWFSGKLVSPATRWDELNTNVQASGQLLLPHLPPARIASDCKFPRPKSSSPAASQTVHATAAECKPQPRQTPHENSALKLQRRRSAMKVKDAMRWAIRRALPTTFLESKIMQLSP